MLATRPPDQAVRLSAFVFPGDDAAGLRPDTPGTPGPLPVTPQQTSFGDLASLPDADVTAEADDFAAGSPLPDAHWTADSLLDLLEEGSTADDVQARVDAMVGMVSALSARLAHGLLPATKSLVRLQAAQDALMAEVHQAGAADCRDTQLVALLDGFTRVLALVPASGWAELQGLAEVQQRCRLWTALLDDFAPRLAPHTFVGHGSLAPAPVGSVLSPEATMEELVDVMQTVKRSPTTPARATFCAELARRGIRVERYRALPCQALEWPQDYPQFPGLRGFMPSFVAAYQRNPDVLADRRAFAQALFDAAGPEQGKQSLLSFLARYRYVVVGYLGQKCLGRALTVKESQALCGAAPTRRLGGFQNLLASHAAALADYVDAWGRRGFAAHWSEVQVFLSQRGLPLSRRQVRDIPSVLPALVSNGSWVYRAGDAPQLLHNFMPTCPGTMEFRGDPPRPAAPGAARQVSRAQGLAAALLDRHPGGFSLAQASALLARVSPGKTKGGRSGFLRAVLRGNWIVAIDPKTWCLNPAILCAAARRAILAHVPPGTVWPSAPPAPLRDPATARRVRRPHDREPVRGDTDARRAHQIFGVLAELHGDSGLGPPYVITDRHGHRSFAFDTIIAVVLQLHPSLKRAQVLEHLRTTSPATLTSLLQSRRWALPRITFAQLDAAFRSLATELPFFYCLSDNALANVIADRVPGAACTVVSLRDYCASKTPDRDAIRTHVDALVRDGRIHLFYKNGLSQTLNLISLRHYLALHQVGANTRALELCLAGYPPDALRREQRGISPYICQNHASHRVCVDRVARQLGLHAGDAAPSWPVYQRAFETLFCAPVEGVPTLQYSGATITRLYLAVKAAVEAGTIAPRAAPKRKEAPDDTHLPRPKRGRTVIAKHRRYAGPPPDTTAGRT